MVAKPMRAPAGAMLAALLAVSFHPVVAIEVPPPGVPAPATVIADAVATVTNAPNLLEPLVEQVIAAPAAVTDATTKAVECVGGVQVDTADALPGSSATGCLSPCLADGCTGIAVPQPDLSWLAATEATAPVALDLAVEGVETAVVAFQTYEVHATVRNLGTLPAPSYRAFFGASVADYRTIHGQTLQAPPLGPGEATVLTFAWGHAEPALYALTVLVDAGNRIIEDNEANNALEVRYGVPTDPPINGRQTFPTQDPLTDLLNQTFLRLGQQPPASFSPLLVERALGGDVDLSAQTLISIPWVIQSFGNEWGATHPFEVIEGDGGPYLRFTDGVPDTTRLASVTVGASALYTLGSTATVTLERPMVVTFQQVPTATATPRVVETQAGPVTVAAVEPSGPLAVDFTDDLGRGQVVRYSVAWLHGMGFSAPRFELPGGELLPWRLVAGVYEVRVPHFTTVYTFDSSSEGFRAINPNNHQSAVAWNPGTGRIEVEAHNEWPSSCWSQPCTSFPDMRYARDLDTPFTASDTFEASATFSVNQPGNSIGWYPFYLGGGTSGIIFNDPGAIWFHVQANYNVWPVEVKMGYAPAAGQTACGGAVLFQAPGDLLNRVLSTKVAYDAPSHTLTLGLYDATTRLMESSCTVATTFKAGMVGVSNSRGVVTSPGSPYAAGRGWVDNVRVHSTAPVNTPNPTAGPAPPSNPAPPPPAKKPIAPQAFFALYVRGSSQAVVGVEDLSVNPDGYELEYRWDFGDGTVTPTKNPRIGHAFPCVDGQRTYTIHFTVKDSRGYASTATKAHTVYGDDHDNDGLLSCMEDRFGTDPNKEDTDNDGLTDAQELNGVTVHLAAGSNNALGLSPTYRSHPTMANTDGDGALDGVEVFVYRTNPSLADTDHDGAPDSLDADPHIDLNLRLHATRYKVQDRHAGAGVFMGMQLYDGLTDPFTHNKHDAKHADAAETPTWGDLVLEVPDWEHQVSMATLLLESTSEDPYALADWRYALGDPGEPCKMAYSFLTGLAWAGDSPYDADGYGICNGKLAHNSNRAALWAYPHQVDADGDGIPFTVEVATSTPPLSAYKPGTWPYQAATFPDAMDPFTNDRDDDLDEDGALNGQELRLGTEWDRRDIQGHHVKVGLKWQANTREVQSIQRGITGANPIIWDATDGRFFISRVTIYNGLEGWEANWTAADVHIYPDVNGRLGTWYKAVPYGISYQGLKPNCTGSSGFCKNSIPGVKPYLWMAQSFSEDNRTILGTAAHHGWSKTFAHEWGHYAFGLRDEYYSTVEPPGPDDKCAGDHPAERWCNDNTHCYSGGDLSTGQHNRTLMSGSGLDPGYEFSVESDKTHSTKTVLSSTYHYYSCGYTAHWQTEGHSAWWSLYHRFRNMVDLQMVESSPGTFDPSWKPRSGPFEPVGDLMTWL